MSRIRRSFGVTVLVGLVLMFTGLQVLRVWASIANWDFLVSVPLRINPLYFVLSGAVWATVGGWLAAALWSGRHWTPEVLQAATLAYAAFHWVDRLWLQARGPQSSNMTFEAVLTFLLVGLIFGILAPAGMRKYFRSE